MEHRGCRLMDHLLIRPVSPVFFVLIGESVGKAECDKDKQGGQRGDGQKHSGDQHSYDKTHEQSVNRIIG